MQFYLLTGKNHALLSVVLKEILLEVESIELKIINSARQVGFSPLFFMGKKRTNLLLKSFTEKTIF